MSPLHLINRIKALQMRTYDPYVPIDTYLRSLQYKHNIQDKYIIKPSSYWHLSTSFISYNISISCLHAYTRHFSFLSRSRCSRTISPFHSKQYGNEAEPAVFNIILILIFITVASSHNLMSYHLRDSSSFVVSMNYNGNPCRQLCIVIVIRYATICMVVIALIVPQVIQLLPLHWHPSTPPPNSLFHLTRPFALPPYTSIIPPTKAA